MRTLTTQQLATLSSAAGYSTYARVKVERSSTWHDLTSLFGLDFLEEVTWSEHLDAPVATAQVRLLREVNGASLAPLVTSAAANLVSGSYSPLLKEGRRFTVEVAVVPLGMAASSWTEAFRGLIDEIDVGEDGITFSGRDELGATLQDTFIETEREYGSTLGVAVQTVLQSILNDNGLSAITLYTQVSPGVVLGKYVQKCEAVADAFRAIVANRMGWEYRQRWLSSGPGTGSWRLWLHEPNRSASAADWTYGPGEYQNLSEVRTTREDVRNAFECVYSDTADLDAAGNPKRKTVSTSDATSIAAYGRRFMRLAEEATSAINTSSEASALIGRAKADLKDVPLGVSFEVLLHPGLELGDMVKLTGNTVHFSADQTAAVLSLTHVVNAHGGATRLVLRGKPSISIRTWLEMEQRPHLGPLSPFTGPDAPTGFSSEVVPQGFRLRFNPPTTGPAAEEYELHVSTTNGFTPSSSTRRVVGKLTEMVVTDLTPGTTYYAVVVPRDSKGNRGTASAQQTLVPRYVEPRSLQPYTVEAQLPRNGNFEAQNDSAAPPDTWTMVAGTWGVDASVISGAETGTKAVRLSSGSAQIACQPFTCRAGQRVSVEIYAKRSGGTSGLAIAVDWLDAALASTDQTFVNPAESLVNGSYVRLTGVTSTPDTDARYARLVLFGSTLSSPNTIDVDSVTLNLIDPATEAVHVLTVSPANEFQNGWTQYGVGRASAGYFKNNLGEVILRGTIRSGTIGAVAFTLPAGYRPVGVSGFVCRGNGGTSLVDVASNGDVTVVAAPDSTLVDLSGIRFRAA